MPETMSRIGWEPVRKMYAPKMKRVMRALYADLKDNHPQANAGEPWEMDADDYWVVICCKPDGKEPFDISFKICESQDYEGMAGGFTFRVDVVEEGGRILGELSPFNYTEKCWCTNHKDIRERFEQVTSSLDGMTAYLEENVLDV